MISNILDVISHKQMPSIDDADTLICYQATASYAVDVQRALTALGQENCSISAQFSRDIQIGQTRTRTGVCGIDVKWQEFIPYEILSGRFFTKQELHEVSHVCVVDKYVYDKVRKRPVLGDTIWIDGQAFEVIGVIQGSFLMGDVLIPIATYLDMTPTLLQCAIYARAETQQAQQFIQTKLEQTFSRVSWTDGNVYINMNTDSYNTRLHRYLIICAAAFVFSFVNILQVLISKLQGDLHQIGVKTAIGAQRHDLFVECSLKNVFLLILSFPFTYIALWIITPILPSQLVFSHSWSAYVVTYAAGFLLCILMAYLAAWSTLRKQVSNLVGGGI